MSYLVVCSVARLFVRLIHCVFRCCRRVVCSLVSWKFVRVFDRLIVCLRVGLGAWLRVRCCVCVFVVVCVVCLFMSFFPCVIALLIAYAIACLRACLFVLFSSYVLAVVFVVFVVGVLVVCLFD